MTALDLFTAAGAALAYLWATWTLTEWRWVKIQAIGSGIRAKTWLDGETEPETWSLSATDATTATGLVGISPFDSGNDMEVAEVIVKVYT